MAADDFLSDRTFLDLAKALKCWLDFQIHCRRSALLSEAYLTQPLGEFLLANYSGMLEREMNHPQFKVVSKGRPKQIDFVLKSKDEGYLDFGIECKWSGNHPPDRQGIVDDVMRLECLRRPVGQAGYSKRYFILAGHKAAMEKFLGGRINKTGLNPPPKFINGFLPTSRSSKAEKFKLKECEIHYRTYFRSFAKAYKTDLPKTYKAKMVADETGEYVRVLIWSISSSQNRATFPKSGW
jgi:hypothetical protein